MLDQIILKLFDYIIIYCSSSSTIEHSNGRWGFQLIVWLYICITTFRVNLCSLCKFFPVGDILTPVVRGFPQLLFFLKVVVIPHHVREYQTSLTYYCGNVCDCMADVLTTFIWRKGIFLKLTFTCFYEFASLLPLTGTVKAWKLTHLKIIFNKFRKNKCYYVRWLHICVSSENTILQFRLRKNKGKNKDLLWITWLSGILLNTHTTKVGLIKDGRKELAFKQSGSCKIAVVRANEVWLKF